MIGGWAWEYVHGIMSLDDPEDPLVWCLAEVFSVAVVDPDEVTCPECIAERGWAEWKISEEF